MLRRVDLCDVDGSHGLLLQLLFYIHVLKVVVRVGSTVECVVITKKLGIILCSFEVVKCCLTLRCLPFFVVLV